MTRRTKIIATLGPSTDNADMLERIIAAGVDLVRLNFSHGPADEHRRRVEAVRATAKKMNCIVGVLADLQGPKIRIARFKNNNVELNIGDEFVLDAKHDSESGDNTVVGIDYKQLPKDVSEGDRLLLDDGRIVLQVKKVSFGKIYCDVIVGGELSNHKGINREGGGLSAKALTDKDKQDLKVAAELNVDYIAISFPRSADDIVEAKKLIEKAGSNAGVIAKIERKEAVGVIDEIINESAGVMVARGDLGVEIGDAELPAVQKHIIQRARALNKPAITATQMMESMIHNVLPTRAEVSDVANAVLDGTDAVMLSAETAVGDHPDVVVEAMSRVCVSAEKNPMTTHSKHRVECEFQRVDEAIAMATMYTANHIKVKAIISLTESGSTPLLMSRIRSGIPVYALSRNINTRGRATLYRGVYPIAFDVTQMKSWEVNRASVAELEKRELVSKGDLVIITKGDHMGIHGGTNAMKIVAV